MEECVETFLWTLIFILFWKRKYKSLMITWKNHEQYLQIPLNLNQHDFSRIIETPKIMKLNSQQCVCKYVINMWNEMFPGERA